MAFNTLVVDIHPYVADEIFAKEEGLFGRRLVAGAFVFSAGIGLVATNWLQAFSYGYDRLRFIKPVFIGDSIYTIRTNLAKEPKYEERGLTRAKLRSIQGTKGELVLIASTSRRSSTAIPRQRARASEGVRSVRVDSASRLAMTTDLRGMAWDHPRARDPLAAISAAWSKTNGVAVHWDARPLKDFEDQPLEELASRYDLVLIDYPFVGVAAKSGLIWCAVNDWVDAAYLADQGEHSVGPSFASYDWAGKQWALAIDAACQVSAVRDDLWRAAKLGALPSTWDQVAQLAAANVAMPGAGSRCR